MIDEMAHFKICHFLEYEIDTVCVFVFQKYGKFYRIFFEHFIKHKPLTSEEWADSYFDFFLTMIIYRIFESKHFFLKSIDQSMTTTNTPYIPTKHF